MKIMIENYYGNDVLGLHFACMNQEITPELHKEVEDLIYDFGYNVADIDEDDDIQYIRLQEFDVDNTDDEARGDYLEMVKLLVDKFT